MAAHWKVIDTLVRDIGALAVDVHMAERTLATDPRTSAARHALDSATEAVCTAIDETSETAAAEASRAIQEARTMIGQLGLTIQDSRKLVAAAQDLTSRLEGGTIRAASLRARAVDLCGSVPRRRPPTRPVRRGRHGRG